MIAYDIYLKTAFELLIQERIRSFLFRRVFYDNSATTEQLFESKEVIEDPPKPDNWKEEYEKDKNIVSEFANDYYNSVITHQDAQQDFLNWKEILTGQQEATKKLPTRADGKQGVWNNTPAASLSISDDYFADFYKAADEIWNYILGWTVDETLINKYSRLIFGTDKNVDLQKVDLKHCNMNWYAENLYIGWLMGITELPPITDTDGKTTLKQWIDEEVQGMEQTNFTFRRNQFNNKCNAKYQGREGLANMYKKELDVNEEYYKYAAWFHEVTTTTGFINNLKTRKSLDLFLFAAYCLKEQTIIFNEEITKEQIQEEGKQHLYAIFKQAYEDEIKWIAPLITGGEETDFGLKFANEATKLIEFDNLIDFSIFTLIDEMDK